MNLPVHLPAEARPFQGRTAFLLNANARSVTSRVAARMREVVPEGDLFLSHTLDDAELFVATILRRGYDRLFIGGGDGTLVVTVNLVDKLCRRHGHARPQLGMLKLGTGNAMAHLLGAKSAVVDAAHVASHGEATPLRIDLIECGDGTLTPFAGMGYDGEVLNDYLALKRSVRGPLGRYLVESVWGYLGAMLTRTVPRHLSGIKSSVRVVTKEDAVFMRHEHGADVEVAIPAGTVLHDGPVSYLSVGSIPYFGYGFMMFPFARTKDGYLQLRIGAAPVRSILANLFPGVWHGTWRHPKMWDFLVKDVEIECSHELAYQVGGDAAGYARKLSFKVASAPVEMLELGPRKAPALNPFLKLLPAFDPKRA